MANVTFALLLAMAFVRLGVAPLLVLIAFRVRHQRPTAVPRAVEDRATPVSLLAMPLATDRPRHLRLDRVRQGLLLLMCSPEQRRAPSQQRLLPLRVVLESFWPPLNCGELFQTRPIVSLAPQAVAVGPSSKRFPTQLDPISVLGAAPSLIRLRLSPLICTVCTSRIPPGTW